MASIDKIYGTRKQLITFIKWLKENNKSYFLRYVSDPSNFGTADTPDFGIISNFTVYCDMYLLKNCPLKFITNRIKVQYNIKKRRSQFYYVTY